VSAAELDSEAGSTAGTTSFVYSSTFIPAATPIDGVAVKVSARTASPSGTVSITLANNTAPGTREGTTTINVTDINSNGNGWYFFKFGATVTPLGTDVYKIGFKTSIAGELTLYRDATAGNWSRMVRLTSGASTPTAGDKLMIMGEMTAATTSNSFTVTMDSTSSINSYGPTVSGGPPQGLVVCDKSTFAYGTTASTNYYLKTKGILAVYNGGTFTIGTSGTRIPSTGSAILEFDSAANVDSGLSIFPGATFNAYGATKTTTKTLLTADATGASTITITVAAATDWAVNDSLAIASTTQTASQCEAATIGSPSGTSITLSTFVTNSHSGTSPTQAEVVNLTRNVKIRGVSATLQGYCLFQTTSTVACQYVEFTQLGSATSTKRGIDVTTTTGSCSLTFCSLHDSTVASSIGFNVTGSSSSNVTFSNNVTFNIANVHFQIAVTSGTWTADSNVFMRNTDASTNLVTVNDFGGTFTNNTSVGATGNGFSWNEASGSVGTFSGDMAHSNANNGLLINGGPIASTLSNMTLWRNAGSGITIAGPGALACTLSNITFFGNQFQNVVLGPTAGLLFTGCTLNGDSTFPTSSGVVFNNPVVAEVFFENCDFSTVSGIKTAHTSDIVVSANQILRIYLRNTKLGAATEVSSQSNLVASSIIASQRHDQTVATHKAWFKYGTISYDTVTFKTASPAELLTPNNASNKLESGPKYAAVASGGTITPTVYVNKSAAYNGNQPRLVVKKNVAAGISADTVLATAVGGTGSWLTLTGTTAAVTDDAVLQFVVDCDGTAGTVSVDDWSVA
jgi:hypothetical protein